VEVRASIVITADERIAKALVSHLPERLASVS
jgi:hypothetical protein